MIIKCFYLQKVSPAESGYYKCVSKNIDGSGYSVGEVKMLVTGSAFSAIDAVKLAAIIISIVVIIGCAVLYYRLRKDWKKYEGRSIAPGLYLLFITKYLIVLVKYTLILDGDLNYRGLHNYYCAS